MADFDIKKYTPENANPHYAGAGSAWRKTPRKPKLQNGKWDANKNVINPAGIPNGPGPGGTWPGAGMPLDDAFHSINGQRIVEPMDTTPTVRGGLGIQPEMFEAVTQEAEDYVDGASYDKWAKDSVVNKVAPLRPGKTKTPKKQMQKRAAVKRVLNKPQMVQMQRTTSGNPFAKNFGGWGQLFQGDKTVNSGGPITRSAYNEKLIATGNKPLTSPKAEAMRATAIANLRNKRKPSNDILDLF